MPIVAQLLLVHAAGPLVEGGLRHLWKSTIFTWSLPRGVIVRNKISWAMPFCSCRPVGRGPRVSRRSPTALCTSGRPTWHSINSSSSRLRDAGSRPGDADCGLTRSHRRVRISHSCHTCTDSGQGVSQGDGSRGSRGPSQGASTSPIKTPIRHSCRKYHRRFQKMTGDSRHLKQASGSLPSFSTSNPSSLHSSRSSGMPRPHPQPARGWPPCALGRSGSH